MYDLRINELWDHGIEKQWLERLDSYWNMKSVRENFSIEREMDCIHNDLQQIKDMDGEQFYDFLYQKYFVWKYTASMDVKDGVYIERLLIEKANDLNNRFETDFWTPRKIDMVLWTYRESE